MGGGVCGWVVWGKWGKRGLAGRRDGDGVACGLQGRRHTLEQIGHQSGYGGVHFGSELARLAVEFWGDGDGDIADFSHGFALLGRRVIAASIH